MEKPKVYLDTSVINFLFADDAPEKKEITIDFFENFIKLGVYDVFVSDYVIQELKQTSLLEKRNLLLNALVDYPIMLWEIPDDGKINDLAGEYLKNGVMPPKKIYDALHVACTTVAQIDYLASWNYKHLANVNREKRVLEINASLGYSKIIRILTPTELIGYGS